MLLQMIFWGKNEMSSTMQMFDCLLVSRSEERLTKWFLLVKKFRMHNKRTSKHQPKHMSCKQRGIYKLDVKNNQQLDSHRQELGELSVLNCHVV